MQLFSSLRMMAVAILAIMAFPAIANGHKEIIPDMGFIDLCVWEVNHLIGHIQGVYLASEGCVSQGMLTWLTMTTAGWSTMLSIAAMISFLVWKWKWVTSLLRRAMFLVPRIQRT